MSPIAWNLASQHSRLGRREAQVSEIFVKEESAATVWILFHGVGGGWIASVVIPLLIATTAWQLMIVGNQWSSFSEHKIGITPRMKKNNTTFPKSTACAEERRLLLEGPSYLCYHWTASQAPPTRDCERFLQFDKMEHWRKSLGKREGKGNTKILYYLADFARFTLFSGSGSILRVLLFFLLFSSNKIKQNRTKSRFPKPHQHPVIFGRAIWQEEKETHTWHLKNVLSVQ